jgi:tetraacyldisaccharide-1-P 4'-kinase
MLSRRNFRRVQNDNFGDYIVALSEDERRAPSALRRLDEIGGKSAPRHRAQCAGEAFYSANLTTSWPQTKLTSRSNVRRGIHWREPVTFAGIARPEKFYATLRRVGAQIVMTRNFADHHAYTPREIEALIDEAGRRNALLATTEKDLVRLDARHARAVVTLPRHPAVRGTRRRAADAAAGAAGMTRLRLVKTASSAVLKFWLSSID